jgi:hypothetical protein
VPFGISESFRKSKPAETEAAWFATHGAGFARGIHERRRDPSQIPVTTIVPGAHPDRASRANKSQLARAGEVKEQGEFTSEIEDSREATFRFSNHGALSVKLRPPDFGQIHGLKPTEAIRGRGGV